MAGKIEIDTEQLINLVEVRPVLWDKTLSQYKDKVLTKNAWADICNELHNEFEQMGDKEKNEFGKTIIKRWWNVRDSSLRYRKKQKELNKSGAGTSNIKKYIYCNQLEFLIKVAQERPTEDSLSDRNASQQDDIHAAAQENLNQPIAEKEKNATFRKLESRKRKADPVEAKMLQILEQPTNRHSSFFNGIIPSLTGFDEDDIISFQIGVLQLISNIKQQKRARQSATHLQARQAATNYALPNLETTQRTVLQTRTQFPGEITEQNNLQPSRNTGFLQHLSSTPSYAYTANQFSGTITEENTLHHSASEGIHQHFSSPPSYEYSESQSPRSTASSINFSDL